jgi:hypothetical protein
MQTPKPHGSYVIHRILPAPVARAIWFKVAGVCALADSERHLGHAVRKGGAWLAFDTVHANASHDGFLYLGRFKAGVDAQRAIESSVGITAGLKAAQAL